jgi:monovalent cation:H+ antiporter-2, CPA2 family
LVSALNTHGIPYSIIEMNLNTIKRLQQENIPCHFGDVSHPDILRAAGGETAKILAITFPDIRTSEVAIQHVKHMNPNIICLARARYRADIDKLYALGADEVIYEEFESSISFIFNTLHALGQPVDTINHLLTVIREQEQRSMREIPIEEQPAFGRLSLLADTKIEWLELKPQSPLVGKTLLESEIRKHTGVNVLSIVDSDGQHSVNPTSDYLLKAHDILVVVGTIEQLHKLEMLVP